MKSRAASCWTHGARARAFFAGTASVIGMESLVAWGLSVDPSCGLVYTVDPTSATPIAPPTSVATGTVEVWYEVEVTNPSNQKSTIYTALVDTGSSYSAFPSTVHWLGAKPGGQSHTATHRGNFRSLLSVFNVRLLRRAYRNFTHEVDDGRGGIEFSWHYDASVTAPLG